MKQPRLSRDEMSPHERRVHLAGKDTLRTNETAELLTMAGHQVGGAVLRRQIDAGEFPGRRIPGSTFRVTDRAKLDAWMRERRIDVSSVTPTTLELADAGGVKDAVTRLDACTLRCYDTFTLAQLLLEHPVTRIVIAQVRDDVADVVARIRKACETRRYPQPAIETAGQPPERSVRRGEPDMAGAAVSA